MSTINKYGKQNLLQKLYNRQIFGKYVDKVSLNYEPARQLFSDVPRRLIFRLQDTIPNVGNHILMGATRCGQMLMTYTYNVDAASDFTPTTHYRYRLHFWLFRPGHKSVKIAEVQLFDGADVSEMLSIKIIQWPNDNKRLLVYGRCNSPCDYELYGEEREDFSSWVYITMTTLPSLTGCEKCKLVASSFNEDEMAANWDAGVGLSCIQHGLTVHTHFSASRVYKLEPEICLSSDGRVVVNTGSFLHVLSVNVENSLKENVMKEISIDNRLKYNFLKEKGFLIFLSEDWACNMVQLLSKRLYEGYHLQIGQLPFCLQYALQRHVGNSAIKCKVSDKRMNCGDWAVALLQRPKQKWFSSNDRSFPRVNIQKQMSTENVYDFTEMTECEETQFEPRFKLFRRRCLADKMYEFRSDEDIAETQIENIRPDVISTKISTIDITPMSICDTKEDKKEETAEPNLIVKAIIADWDVSLVETEAERREKVYTRFISGFENGFDNRRNYFPLKLHNLGRTRSKYGIRKSSHKIHPRKFQLTDNMLKEMERGYGHQPVSGCSVKFTRHYVDIDQEMISTITDIEDDDIGPGYHCALPISVHGASYSQMEMISNQKAEKLTCIRAAVKQSSLDIEQLSYKAAEAICRMEGFKFWFCQDYDTEIIRVCPFTGDVLGILYIRINAELIKEGDSRRINSRNFYETSCLYIWNPTSNLTHLEGYRNLRHEPTAVVRPWYPAVKEAKELRELPLFLPGYSPRVLEHKVLDNLPIFSLNEIIDHDNLIGFCKVPKSSPWSS